MQLMIRVTSEVNFEVLVHPSDCRLQALAQKEKPLALLV